MKIIFDSKKERDEFLLCEKPCPSCFGLEDVPDSRCNLYPTIGKPLTCVDCWMRALEAVSEVREPVEVKIDAEGMYMPDESPKMPGYNELEEKRKRMNKSVWQGR